MQTRKPLMRPKLKQMAFTVTEEQVAFLNQLDSKPYPACDERLQRDRRILKIQAYTSEPIEEVAILLRPGVTFQ